VNQYLARSRGLENAELMKEVGVSLQRLQLVQVTKWVPETDTGTILIPCFGPNVVWINAAQAPFADAVTDHVLVQVKCTEDVTCLRAVPLLDELLKCGLLTRTFVNGEPGNCEARESRAQAGWIVLSGLSLFWDQTLHLVSNPLNSFVPTAQTQLPQPRSRKRDLDPNKPQRGGKRGKSSPDKVGRNPSVRNRRWPEAYPESHLYRTCTPEEHVRYVGFKLLENGKHLELSHDDDVEVHSNGARVTVCELPAMLRREVKFVLSYNADVVVLNTSFAKEEVDTQTKTRREGPSDSDGILRLGPENLDSEGKVIESTLGSQGEKWARIKRALRKNVTLRFSRVEGKS
jgi:hypothetical protein